MDRYRCLDVEKPIRSTIHLKKAIENSVFTVIICVYNHRYICLCSYYNLWIEIQENVNGS